MSATERTTARSCPNCGAAVASRGARFCEFCGYELPQDDRPPAYPPPPEDERRVVFQRLRSSPEFTRALAHQPRLGTLLVGPIVGIAFVVVFLFVAVGMTGFFGMVGGGGFALFPLLFVVFGIGMLVAIGRRVHELATSPLLRIPARVLDERTEVSGGGHDRSASTSYFVALEDEHGTRHEYRTTGKVAGRVVPGDAGVAFLKGRYLVDFLPITR